MTEEERLAQTYEIAFGSDEGEKVVKDLENFILRSSPFFAEDIATDALLREGARHLLSYIYAQLNK